MNEDAAVDVGHRLLDKYGIEREHALHVERLSMRLFEGVRDIAGFAPEHRGLLRFAALAHDIGHYIDSKHHHEHSAYLIRRDAAAKGLTEPDREAAAWVALNHRKRKLLEPDRFAGKERRMMGRLAILLRLADALDYEHRQEAKVLSVESAKGEEAWSVRIAGYDVEKHEKRVRKKLSFAGEFGWSGVTIEVEGINETAIRP